MKKGLAILLSAVLCMVFLSSTVWAKDKAKDKQIVQEESSEVATEKNSVPSDRLQQGNKERIKKDIKKEGKLNRGQAKKAEREAQLEEINKNEGQEIEQEGVRAKNFGQAKKLEERIRVRGRCLKYDIPPVIKEGRTLIPVRAIMNGLGADVKWDAETKTVTITRDGKEIILKLDSDEVLVNGEKVIIDTPAQLICNRTFVPLRFIAQTLGEKVDYDKETGEINVGDDEKTDEDIDEDIDDDIDEVNEEDNEDSEEEE